MELSKMDRLPIDEIVQKHMQAIREAYFLGYPIDEMTPIELKACLIESIRTHRRLLSQIESEKVEDG